ncbi:MAG: rubrerythrin family protein [Oscillospiraceae bacterium]|nr:rubrerythrin family protein [Oscillospiraceae bacterium]
MELKHSETAKNLMRAFAGESQARNRYTFAADTAKKQKLHVIEAVFTFTAHQERSHAKLFYDFLSDLEGEELCVDGAYPVNLSNDVMTLLQQAADNENHEHSDVYARFAKTAYDEGFANVGAAFEMVANIERTHAERFSTFLELMRQDKLFVSDISCGWMCLNCGHVFEGTHVPEICPVCKHDRGFFIRLCLAPYVNN